jgi:hypothetical protein
MAGSAGGAVWFLEEMNQKNGYEHYKHFRTFTRSIPWNKKSLKPLSGVLLSAGSDTNPKRSDAVIKAGCLEKFIKIEEPDIYLYSKTGKINGTEKLQSYLHCHYNRKSIPAFHTDSDNTSKFFIKISEAVGKERVTLTIRLDGETVHTRTYETGPAKGIKSVKAAKGPNWLTTYNDEIHIKIPAGRHILEIEASAGDRLAVSYRITDYFLRKIPAEIRGLETKQTKWIWVRNLESSAAVLFNKGEISQIKNLELQAHITGKWHAVIFDTWTGKKLMNKKVTAGRSPLLQLPAFKHDIAILLNKSPEINKAVYE